MKKEVKVLFLIVLVLGLGLAYSTNQIISLKNRVDEIDWLMIETGVTIDYGEEIETDTAHLTRGATALEALQRVAKAKTKTYSGMGVYITEINGVKENKQTDEYWITYSWDKNNENWSMLETGVDSYELEEKENIKFSYEKSPW